MFVTGFIQRTLDALSVYYHKRVLILLLLGFSAGLPYMLVFSTLSFWLREAGVDRTAIGYFSWITLAYGLKWAWSPLVDRLSLPILTRFLGRRRSWMLFAQLLLVGAILGMSFSDPLKDLERLALFALMIAFASATQDIVIDAFRIESAPEKMQAALAAAYQVGYRGAMIVATAGALTIAAWVEPGNTEYNLIAWQTSYLVMAGLMFIGVLTTLFSREPKVDTRTADATELALKQRLSATYPRIIAAGMSWVYTACILPFIDFFKRYGYSAILILLLISCYRISDIVMGIMANVFYVDMGFTKEEIAYLSKIYGLIMTLVGAAFGGVLLARFGTMKILFLGALLVAVTNLLFAWQALIGYNVPFLTFAISVDNFSAGIATVAFMAYLSSLTSNGYSATQYALLSSIMVLFPKFIAGFSGAYVDAYGYVNFFVAASVIGFPVLLLIHLVNKYAPTSVTNQTKNNQI
ncbi:AmpG family muropeptide MFS transporter [Shewanella xiamenensis]|uniref:AmpG family muropeptide MFS transporter n=1 Tax=Shewanella xiamenensis TaxID=332186 RepID=UPI001184B173|nr:MFS transporter [Shewanella xiamenensis]TVL17373.1 AmpG family muropeptide MFS transporter [Shewanella xiamenensis]TVL17657.1 AmpG family muropeptide MFS transporter [Shewanella xiamenensis]TVL25148.1 AmpG family muropeptide MFS transporter [Shewanella xiamenensis]TVL31140.1 AmpG family muropeptide MFS transporter [Shewanella xiamenensis]TVP00483.1 AmpG family muropeptide MFS transporter [Shewanella xiamenensis]